MPAGKPAKSAAVPRTACQIGRYIVADPRVCHGKLTFRGTRIFVSDVLEQVEGGLPWDAIVEGVGGKSSPRGHPRGRKAGAGELLGARCRVLRARWPAGGFFVPMRAAVPRNLSCYSVFVHTSILALYGLAQPDSVNT